MDVRKTVIVTQSLTYLVMEIGINAVVIQQHQSRSSIALLCSKHQRCQPIVGGLGVDQDVRVLEEQLHRFLVLSWQLATASVVMFCVQWVRDS